MKYQLAVFGKRVSPDLTRFQQVYFPVDQRDGAWVPCGPLRPDPGVLDEGDMFMNAAAYLDGTGRDCGPLEDITPPEGWTVEARLWLPDDYVPPSQEVLEEGESRARELVQDAEAKYRELRSKE